MKAAIVLGALILVIGLLIYQFYQSVEAKGGPDTELAPTLFTLLDSVDIEPLEEAHSDYVNVEGFRKFKVYIRRTGPDNVGDVFAKLHTSLDGVTDPKFGGTGIPLSVSSDDGASSPADYVHDNVFAPGPHIFLKGSARNQGTGTQNISMFLYAVP